MIGSKSDSLNTRTNISRSYVSEENSHFIEEYSRIVSTLDILSKTNGKHDNKCEDKFVTNTKPLNKITNNNKPKVSQQKSNSINEYSSGFHISDPRLAKLKLNLKPQTFKCYEILLKVIKEISNNNCNNIIENDWKSKIPRKMNQNGCKIGDKGYWRRSFDQLVDLYLKVIYFYSFKTFFFSHFDFHLNIYFVNRSSKCRPIMKLLVFCSHFSMTSMI
jgi:hypothetical protein